MKDDDFDAMMKNLQEQGLKDIVEIELASGKKSSSPKTTGASTASTAAPSTPVKGGDVKPGKFDPRPDVAGANTFHGRRAPGGQSTIVFG